MLLLTSLVVRFTALCWVSHLGRLVTAQVLGDGNSTSATSQIEAPDGLSAGCSATFNQTVACDTGLYSIVLGELFPTDDILVSICIESCLTGLESFRESQLSACSSDVVVVEGLAYPPTYTTDLLLFTYNYTCLKDPTTQAYCLPQFDEWNNDTNPTTAEACSDCNLLTMQTQLDSVFGWDDDFAEVYSSMTQSCGVTKYPVASPSPYSLNGTATATATATATTTLPSVSCTATYTVQAGDDCHSISKSEQVSTFYLMYANNLAGYCSEFPEAGTNLCIPHSCEIYTVQANDTCYGITQAYNSVFSVTQLTSWNPNINRACTNLNMMEGYEICVSFPGVAQITSTPTNTATASAAPVPTDLGPDVDTDCALYYHVQANDDCASIATAYGISLDDFFFLNPNVTNPNCTNLWLGYSYCVAPVGDITDYPGYGVTDGNPCLVTSAPANCTTTYETDTEVWAWPTVVANATTSAAVPTETATNDLPLASGSLADCSSYDQYYNLTTNSSSSIDPNSCGYVAYYHDVDIDDFISWNPSLSYDEDDPEACVLQPGYRYCSGRDNVTSSSSSSTTPTSTSATATTSATGVVTPTPTQTGMVSNCNAFYLVKSDDGCYDIAAEYGISLDNLYAWNPALDGDCSGLWPDYYICVGIASTSTTATTGQTSTLTSATTTTSTTSNPVSTNGLCGASNSDWTCLGSGFGDCCSEYGYCGSTSDYCSGACQPAYGTCS